MLWPLVAAWLDCRSRAGMGSKTKTKAELLTEIRLLRRWHVSSSISTVVRDLFKYAFFTSIPVCTYLSIASLAGHDTAANIIINFFGSVKINQWVAWAVAGATTGAFLRERRLRKKTT